MLTKLVNGEEVQVSPNEEATLINDWSKLEKDGALNNKTITASKLVEILKNKGIISEADLGV